MTDEFDSDPFTDSRDSSDKIDDDQREPGGSGGDVLERSDIETILKEKEVIQNEFGRKKNKYSVTTTVSRNNRRWKFVTKIFPSLGTGETKIDRDMADWDKFIGKAAQSHLTSCDEVMDRVRKEQEKRKKSARARLIVTAIAIIAVLIPASLWVMNNYWGGHESEISQVIAHLENGEFSQADRLVQQMSSKDNEVKALREKMSTPVRAEVRFQFWKADQQPSAKYASDSSQVKSVILTHTDRYNLNIATPPGEGYLYLYVLQKDHYGKIFMLLPHPEWSQISNPVEHDQNYRIPPEGKWLFLDRLPSDEGGHVPETIYVIASPWKAEDIENLFTKIDGEEDEATRKASLNDLLKSLQSRRDADLVSVFYEEFSFEHGELDRERIRELIGTD